MGGQTLIFANDVVNKKNVHGSKQTIALSLVDTNKIVISA